MLDLDFTITGVEPAAHGLAPLLHFKLKIHGKPGEETIESVILQAQIQIQSPRRSYNGQEKGKLVELFGTPDRWGQTLRTMLWTHAHTTVRRFSGETEAILPVPCTYDLNIAATKYFHALEDGEVPLLFLFSGTIFYAAPAGGLQAQQISWEKECEWRMPMSVWRELMNYHYPNSAWICLHSEVFERLCEFKRAHGLATWEQTVERLLARPLEPAAAPAL